MNLRLILIIASLLFTLSGYAQEQPIDRVVAVVNSDVITESQLDKQVKIAKEQMLSANIVPPSAADIRAKALDQLINTRLQLQIAKKANITVTDEQLNDAISQIAAKNGMTVNKLQQEISQHGMSYNDYLNEIRTEMLISQIQQSQVSPQVSITDQDISDAMRIMKTDPQSINNQDNNANMQYHIIDIVVPLPDNATAADIKQAQQHATKLTAQLQKSNNPQTIISQDNGLQVNDLGWRTASQVPDLFESKLSSLVSGQYSAPIHAPNGIHILNLVATSGGQANNAINYPSNTMMQTQVNVIEVKKNPLFTDNEMQLHLQTIRNQAIESKDFATVAENNSQDANSAEKGGSLGWINPGTLPLAVENTMNQLKVGDVSQPITAGDTYYIVQVTGRRQLSDASTALHDRARQLAFQRKYADTLQHWLQTLRSQSYVKIET